MNRPWWALNGPRTAVVWLDSVLACVLDCDARILFVWAYGYLIVGDSRARHNGHYRRLMSMEHLNYACHAEEFLFPNDTFAV